MPKITSIEGFRKALASERAELLTHILSTYFGWSPIWSYHSDCRFDVRDVLLCLYEAEDVALIVTRRAVRKLKLP